MNTPRTTVRQPLPWFSLLGIGIVLFVTFGGAAVNMIPFHVPTVLERQHEEQREIFEARRAHLAALLAEGDRCYPAIGQEIARALVYDGRSAGAFADDFARRCGDDPGVRGWANAPAPRVRAPRVAPQLDGSAR